MRRVGPGFVRPNEAFVEDVCYMALEQEAVLFFRVEVLIQETGCVRGLARSEELLCVFLDFSRGLTSAEVNLCSGNAAMSELDVVR